jgi:hypothetical protein
VKQGCPISRVFCEKWGFGRGTGLNIFIVQQVKPNKSCYEYPTDT